MFPGAIVCGRADSNHEQPAPHHLQVGHGVGGNCCAPLSQEPEGGLLFYFFGILFLFSYFIFLVYFLKCFLQESTFLLRIWNRCWKYRELLQRTKNPTFSVTVMSPFIPKIVYLAIYIRNKEMWHAKLVPEEVWTKINHKECLKIK